MSIKKVLLDSSAAAWRGAPAPLRYKFLHATQPTFLVGVIGVVRNDEGHVLVMDHRYRVPWSWGLPGGYLQRGEDAVQGLIREVKEETDLDIVADPTVIDVELNPEFGFLSLTLSGRVTGGQLALSSEILSADFYAPDALPEGIYPYHRALIDKASSGE